MTDDRHVIQKHTIDPCSKGNKLRAWLSPKEWQNNSLILWLSQSCESISCLPWRENEASAHSSPRVKPNTHSNLPWESHACHSLLTGNWYFTSQPETHTGCNGHESETNTGNPPGCPCMRGVLGDLASRRADWATSTRAKPSAARLACALSLVCPVSRAPHVCEPCMWHPSPCTLTPEDFSSLGVATEPRVSPIYSQTPGQDLGWEGPLLQTGGCLAFTLYEIKEDVPKASQVALAKNLLASAGDTGLIPGSGRFPGSGRSPGERNGNPLQYSCLRNPMDRGAWWSTSHRVSKSQTPLSTHAWSQVWSPSQGTSVMLRTWTSLKKLPWSVKLKAEEKTLGAYNCLNSKFHSKNVVSRETVSFQTWDDCSDAEPCPWKLKYGQITGLKP